MQKAIIIESSSFNTGGLKLSALELNQHLAEGWRVVSATPLGCSVSNGGKTEDTAMAAAILIIIEKQ